MSLIKHYVLDADHHAVEVDWMTWAEWWENTTNRIVDYTEITSQVHVSTVFLGLDHNFSLFRRGPPVLFETMIFGGPCDGDLMRYVSWDDAETGHKAAVRRAREAIKSPTTKIQL